MWTWMIKDRIWGCSIHSGIWCYQAAQQMWTIIPTSYFMAVGKTWTSIARLGCLEFLETAEWFGKAVLFVNIADVQENECSWLSCNYSTWDWQTEGNERQQVFHLSGYLPNTYIIHWGSGWLGLSRNQPFADFNSKSFASVYPTLECSNYQWEETDGVWKQCEYISSHQNQHR